MSVIYKNSSGLITIEQAQDLAEQGIAVIVNDGKDISFEVDK